MSRVGIKPVEIADGVTVNINGQDVTVKGKKNELKIHVNKDITITKVDNTLVFTPANKEKETRALWGMYRNRLKNMIIGVTEGFTKELEMQGVGYRAAAQGKTLKLSLGFSHEINYTVPAGIEIKTPKPTEIVVTGADIQQVGQVAAEIRNFRKPEPYKGKGVRYVGEYVRRKEGKKK